MHFLQLFHSLFEVHIHRSRLGISQSAETIVFHLRLQFGRFGGNLSCVIQQFSPGDLEEFIQLFDLALLVIRANRSWKEADIVLLDAFKPMCKQEPQVVLNGVELYFLDSVFGEVPKPRSEFRRMITRIILFRFRERSRV